MSFEPRPKIRTEMNYAYIALFVLGVVALLATSRWSPTAHFVEDRPAIPATANSSAVSNGTDRGAPGGLELTMKPKPSLVLVVLTGLSMTMLTVSVFELLKLFAQYAVYYLGRGRGFDRFFGDHASSCSGRGVILVQSDDLNSLVKNALPGDASTIRINNALRSFKARTWVNRWDMEAARAIRAKFYAYQLGAPEIIPADHAVRTEGIPRDRPYDSAEIPFVISTGLGFTDETEMMVLDFNWLKIERRGPCGDCLKIKKSLLPIFLVDLQPHSVETPKTFEVDGRSYPFEDDENFIRLLPKDWDIDRWIETPNASMDYGMILRRTYLIGSEKRRQIRFVVAGFTERATAIAGNYLAENWAKFSPGYMRALHEKAHGYGDFLAIITGYSDGSASWREEFRITQPDVVSKYKAGWPHLHIPDKDAMHRT